MDLNLLSTEPYYDGALIDPNPPTDHQNGGNQWTGAPASNSPQTRKATKQRELPANKARAPLKRENSRAVNVDESTAARQRGRPRLDTRDQTAAERRRTQIRLAQRAYRQRKETTISALNKRVAALENTIERMNRTFLDFNDKATASDIGAGLAGDLKHTKDRFVEYMRRAAPDSEAEDGDLTQVLSANVQGPEAARSDSRVSSPSTAKQAVHPRSPSPRTDMAEMVSASSLGYETAYRTDDGIGGVHAQSSLFDTTQNVQISSLDHVIWSPVQPMQFYQEGFPEPLANMPSVVPPLNQSLPPPTSYNYQETSFGRRLLRTTLQNGIRLLTDPNASREQVLRFFRFTFTWTNRTRCLAKLKELASSAAHESLEFWGAPQWHVGDSGLHYPRTAFDLGSSPPPGWTAKAPMGPRLPGPVPETPMDRLLKPEAIFEITGLGGTWLDSNDVDQYLQTRGIFLDGQSDWAEVDLAVEPTLEPNLTVGSPTESSRTSSGGPQSPQNADLTYPDGPVPQSTECVWNGDGLSLPNFANADGGAFFDEQDIFDPKSMNSPGLIPTNTYVGAAKRVKAPKRIYLDVEKFVKSRFPLLKCGGALLILWPAVVGGSVCLGRTPGFRQSSIDSALSSATRYQF